jgi:hypothetical protein
MNKPRWLEHLIWALREALTVLVVVSSILCGLAFVFEKLGWVR